MLLRLLNFLGGWYRFSGERRDGAHFLNLCMRKCYPYWGFSLTEEQFIVCVRRRVGKELLSECADGRIVLTTVAEGGLPQFLQRYRRRWGLFLGALSCFLLVWLSGRFIWRIEVRGTERYDGRDVLVELAEQGFGVGSYIPPLDVNVLQNRFLLASERFSWVSVNIFGTTAWVEVVEKVEKPSSARENTPVNLIASSDGEIVRLEVRNGFPAVKPGDVVLAGELLVSGIGETKDSRTLVRRAEGKIYAQVVHRLSVDVPFAYVRKVYTGEKRREKRIIFFGKEINLFKKTGILGGSCDTIENERILSVFGQIRVPVSIVTKTELLYTEETAKRDEAAALALAEYLLEEQINAYGIGAEMLYRSVSTTVTDTSVRLDCTLRCVQNIALASPIALGVPAGK